jgi:hypothetical protein
VQAWFGKAIDPTDPDKLRLFIDITRKPDDPDNPTASDGTLIGNIPKLDQAAKDAYAAADPPEEGDTRPRPNSLAAAPCYLGTPDFYYDGGPDPFIVNRGTGGQPTKIGTIKATPRPKDIPIDEAHAYVPPGI